jgi:hypothetical protein
MPRYSRQRCPAWCGLCRPVERREAAAGGCYRRSVGDRRGHAALASVQEATLPTAVKVEWDRNEVEPELPRRAPNSGGNVRRFDRQTSAMLAGVFRPMNLPGVSARDNDADSPAVSRAKVVGHIWVADQPNARRERRAQQVIGQEDRAGDYSGDGPIPDQGRSAWEVIGLNEGV